MSRRLTEALRDAGVDATLLVVEKTTDLPYVVETRFPLLEKTAFLAERAEIFLHNGFSRTNLFKVDTASFGLPLFDHPTVKEADAVILSWVNQGMISLDGVRRIAGEGKKLVWVMHDMWNLTGICHHAMDCRRFEKHCGECPYLGKGAGPDDISHSTFLKKRTLYEQAPISFVAVSSWLAREAGKSALLSGKDVSVIPNAIRLLSPHRRNYGEKKKILFAAATLDNWIKGLDTFKEAIDILCRLKPHLREGAEVVLMGDVRNPDSLKGFSLPLRHLGMVKGDEALANVYSDCDLIVNSSHFENLPGTLVEGQAYGCVPVAFDRGGQRDIIADVETGILCPWNDDRALRASTLAEGMARALQLLEEDSRGVRSRMREKVAQRFSYEAVANKFIRLLSTKC